MTIPINPRILSINDAPYELQESVKEFWPAEQWDNAVSIANLESSWNAFAEIDTREQLYPCGTVLGKISGIKVTAAWTIGWFQINACNLEQGWRPEHLFNTRHNCGTAYAMWADRGWSPWYFSAKKLGLL